MDERFFPLNVQKCEVVSFIESSCSKGSVTPACEVGVDINFQGSMLGNVWGIGGKKIWWSLSVLMRTSRNQGEASFLWKHRHVPG